jgi:multidrug resistance efflux pump
LTERVDASVRRVGTLGLLRLGARPIARALRSAARTKVADQQAAVAELVSQIKSDQAAIENAKAELSDTSLVARPTA